MANRIVSEKEFRQEFRNEIRQIADLSNKRNKHILGVGSRQVTIDVGVEVATVMKDKYLKDGKALDKQLIDLQTPRGMRRLVSQWINSMAKASLVLGANEAETLWKSFGDLIVTGRNGRQSVYVAKTGATEIEFRCAVNLRTGKIAARSATNDTFAKEIEKCAEALSGRPLGEVYAETCAEYFKNIN